MPDVIPSSAQGPSSVTRVQRFLRQAVLSERLPHGLLFLGQDPEAAEQAARALAACLLCEDTPRPPDGCGQCSACKRVRSGHHPDLHVVMAEATAVARGVAEPEGSRKPSLQLRVEQIRDLARQMRMRPYEGRATVAILLDAHKMNDNAANALLKTLEEPGADATLILIAPHERTLLPTVASRCSRLRFPPPGEAATAFDDDEEVAQRLEGLMEGSIPSRLDAIEDLGRDRLIVQQQLAEIEALLVARLRRAIVHGDRPTRPLMIVLDAFDDWREGVEINGHLQMALEELFLMRAE